MVYKMLPPLSMCGPNILVPRAHDPSGLWQARRIVGSGDENVIPTEQNAAERRQMQRMVIDLKNSYIFRWYFNETFLDP